MRKLAARPLLQDRSGHTARANPPNSSFPNSLTTFSQPWNLSSVKEDFAEANLDLLDGPQNQALLRNPAAFGRFEILNAVEIANAVTGTATLFRGRAYAGGRNSNKDCGRSMSGADMRRPYLACRALDRFAAEVAGMIRIHRNYTRALEVVPKK